MSQNRATSHRTFISYIDRTREYYRAQGYEKPYRWARFDTVPFTQPKKPMSELRLTIITTASPWSLQDTSALRGEREVWSGSTEEPPSRLFTDHLSWDKENTHTNDVASFLPIEQMQEQVREGRLGSLAARFHGVPTDYSQRATSDRDAPELLKRCREDEVDIALFVPL